MGKTNYNAIENDTRKLDPLVSHFEYLMNLGEVRATRVVSTLVNGMGSHDNRDVSLDGKQCGVPHHEDIEALESSLRG